MKFAVMPDSFKAAHSAGEAATIELAAAAGLPLMGENRDVDSLDPSGITAVFTIGQRPEPLHIAIAGTASNLESAAENLAHTLATSASHER